MKCELFLTGHPWLLRERPGSSSWSQTQETEPNKMEEAKQYANEILNLQSTQVLCGLSYIATAKYAINITLYPSLWILRK